LLLVDDETQVCAALQRVLFAEGYEIHVAKDAETAMSILAKQPLDVIISDQRMPKKMGTEFLRDVQKLYPHTVRLILSGAAEIGDVARAMEAGVIYKFLTKPIDPALLRANVSEAFSRAASLRRDDSAGVPLFDATTELPTRSYLRKLFDELKSEARVEKKQICLFMFKVDQHHDVLSSFGRSFGRRLARALALHLSQGLGPHCFVSYDSPGIFLALTSDESPVKRIRLVADQVRQLFSTPIEVNDRRITVTVSTGATVAGPDAEFDNLVDEAHTAMMTGSKRGGGTIQLYEPQLVAAFRGRIELESDLREAVIAKLFQLYYQPQVDVASGRIVGLEALLRWPHPRRGFVDPGEFIPITEELGLIHEVGGWVLETAVAELVALRRAGLGAVEMAVNVSALQMSDASFADRVAAVLKRARLPATSLVLEITESAAIEQRSAIADCLEALRGLGVTLAVDDFGTGYANLSNLMKFAFKQLKIDRSLLPGADERSMKLFANVVAMAKALGLTVVAEGVETANELAAAYAAGCRIVQGYYYSPPVAPGKLRDLIRHMFPGCMAAAPKRRRQ
jgi:diguanylate cyclase (GGDEF)-like protein